MRHLLFIVIILSSPAVAAKLYKTVDKDGNVEYTDTPEANTTVRELKLPAVNITPSLALPKLKLDMEAPAAATYKTLEITSPVTNSTVFINEANLSIQVNSIPVINTSEGHALQLLMDNKVISMGPTTSLLLDQVDRGTHTVKARIIDKSGKVLMTSGTTVVHVKQTIQARAQNN